MIKNENFFDADSRFKKFIAMGSRSTVYGSKDLPNTIVKKINPEKSILSPGRKSTWKNEDSSMFENPLDKLNELKIAAHLSAIPGSEEYCVLPLGYTKEGDKSINLYMPKQDGGLEERYEDLQQNSKKHVVHLLEAFVFLLDNQVLQSDIDYGNFLYNREKDVFRISDFGEAYTFEELDTLDDPGAQVIKSYSTILEKIAFCLNGSVDIYDETNPDYVAHRAIINAILKEQHQTVSALLEIQDYKQVINQLKVRISNFIQSIN